MALLSELACIVPQFWSAVQLLAGMGKGHVALGTFGGGDSKMNRSRFFQQPATVVLLVPLILVELAVYLGGCASDPSATLKNPSFRCPSGDVVEPDEGDPSPVQAYPPPGGQRSVAELKDICRRMKRRFADSNLTVEEAGQFYALLKENNEKTPPEGRLHNFTNGTYGFPTGPGDPFVFEKQIMLRKISEEKYEIFYSYIDCGRNYAYLGLYLENEDLIAVIELENRRENYPC